ncbi:hypothetical protein H310_00086 [Aphanomyces invadans]|uniref:CHCH domain-containing protein n=1 Tax=Aphanomyces invadans TaxID=157072 RepID=A0A024UT60_9STRA|nr:hypothetical protein H310_00086 [Aphanomyces invadans]ETW09524.1 hypothetical protein H310_00086 [Aphanomyces invadans]|eukprot:XP_008860935.1 hypothetical protein H310_00086 [Aphanomyces invadans]
MVLKCTPVLHFVTMPSKDCTACKPGDAALHPAAVEATGCRDLYDAVDACMKKHSGSVSKCNDEWQAFRACHRKERLTRP